MGHVMGAGMAYLVLKICLVVRSSNVYILYRNTYLLGSILCTQKYLDWQV